MNGLFSGVFHGRRVLVTGHTGFKGSWLCLWLQALGAHVSGLALRPATRPSHWTALDLDGVDDRDVDLRDAGAVRATLADLRPEVVFHLAAQPLVRQSYRTPVDTFATNVTGLVNLLEAVRSCGSVRALVNATTDKVYRDRETATGYREDDPLGGHDPYSGSKACAEIVSECWRRSYLADAGTRSATARAGNVIGGGDWSDDRLVPDMVRAALAGSALRLRNPQAIRPWQHVLEPLSGYLRLAQLLLAGADVEGPWNFGPASDATLTVGNLAASLQAEWPGLSIEADPGPHPHEAAVLKLDCAKAAALLDWSPQWNAAKTIGRTVAWYRNFHDGGRVDSRADLDCYVADAQAAGAGWCL